MQWTEEHITELRALAALGLTAGNIAQVLRGKVGFPDNLSRNAVIGRLKRSGIPLRNATGSRPWSPRAAKPKPLRKGDPGFGSRFARLRRPAPPVEFVPLVCDLPGRIPFFERKPSECAFIPGEPSYDALCCGEPVVSGQSWCTAHLRHVYVRAGSAEARRIAANKKGWETRRAKREMREAAE